MTSSALHPPLFEQVDAYLAKLRDYLDARDRGASAGRLRAVAGQLGLHAAGEAIAGRLAPGTCLTRSGWSLARTGPGPVLTAVPIAEDLDKVEIAEWERAVLDAAAAIAARRDPGPRGLRVLVHAIALMGDCSEIRAAVVAGDLAGREPPRDIAELDAMAVELVARARRRRGDEHVAALIDALEDGRSPFSRLDPPESTGPPGPDLGPHTPTPEDDEGID